jgi:uncharacterized protein (TIGR02246 family)
LRRRADDTEPARNAGQIAANSWLLVRSAQVRAPGFVCSKNLKRRRNQPPLMEIRGNRFRFPLAALFLTLNSELAAPALGIVVAQIIDMTDHVVWNRLKRRRFTPFILLTVFLFGPLSAKGDTGKSTSSNNSDDRKLVSKVLNNLISAWNKNDAEEIAKLFLPDGVLVTPTGSALRSRSEIKKRVSDERQGKLKDTTLNHTVKNVSVLDNGTALVEGMYELKGMKIMGVETSPQGSFVVRYKKQQGRWMIAKAEIVKGNG